MNTINGIPAHPLIVHALVVLVPLIALLLVLAAALPPIARWAGPVLPLAALAMTVCVPLATESGEWLEERVPETEDVERHAEMGDGLLPWVIALFVVAVGVWWIHGRRSRTGRDIAGEAGEPGEPGNARAVVLWRVVPLVLALAAGVGAVVQVYRIGDSGAKAVWEDQAGGAENPDAG